MQNKIWAGVRAFSGGMWFIADYAGKYEKIVEGVKLINVPAIWLTNMDNPKRHESIQLYKNYTPEEYPTYENYDAIEVGKVAEIPADYDGLMGVPITFLDKYNPAQFDILGMCENLDLFGLKARVICIVACLPFIRFGLRRFGLRLLNSFPRHRGFTGSTCRLIAFGCLGAFRFDSGAAGIVRGPLSFRSSAVCFGLGLGNVIACLLAFSGKSCLSHALDGQTSRVFGDAHHVVRQSAVFLRVIAQV